jgi:hypothetical protein
MCVGFFHALDGVHFGNHDIGEGFFIRDIDEAENIGLPKTGMDLLHTGDFLERLPPPLFFRPSL